MAITLENALKIAQRYPNTYRVYKGDGYTNIIRSVKEANGRYTARKQTFNQLGKLTSTERRIDDNYSIYSSPVTGIFGLQYFTEVKDPKSVCGYHLNRVYAETKPKNMADIRAFYKSQEHNMK